MLDDARVGGIWIGAILLIVGIIGTTLTLIFAEEKIVALVPSFIAVMGLIILLISTQPPNAL